jgi:predicted esterase YcpF (UPF0227 family)
MPAHTATAPTHLLYLHGFRSSPQSFKARRLAAWLAQHRPDVQWWCPQLPPSPAQALALIEAGTRGWPAGSSAVVGSSLGGFYATVWAQRCGWPSVVMNPAVDPARDLARHIGEQTAFHAPEERFFFEPGFVAELRTLTPGPLQHPARCLAIVATGDELLDWREMCSRYQGARLHLIEGSDHALSDFDTHLPHLLKHLQLCD